jgi:RNA polymerase sigma factor (TIGR02999 family)
MSNVTAPGGEITVLLRRWSEGDPVAGEQLTPLVYTELRRIAKGRLRHENNDRALESSELVHEAYLRLVEQDRARWKDRAHFFAICAQIMRRILVDHARSRLRAKRGGGATLLELNEAIFTAASASCDIIALDDALNELSQMDPQHSRVVELRFFAGLSIDETAEAMHLSVATVNRHWVAARAWLMRELSRN